MKKIILFSVIILLFFLTLASAETGCFLLQDSTFYCSDVSEKQATAECLLDQECQLNTIFFPGESCNNKEKFTSCQLVLCKSTCTNELLGNCASGAIPPEETNSWCSPGCCQFQYFGGSFCEFEENKGLCEVEAKNKDLSQFNFQISSKSECSTLCSQSAVFGQTEKIKEGELVSLPEPIQEIQIQEEIKTTESSSGMLWVIIILILVIFFYAVYYHYFRKLFHKTLPPEIKQEKLPWWISPAIINPHLERKIKMLRARRKHKVNELERAEVLQEFGPTKKISTTKEFRKLKGIVRGYKWKQKKAGKTRNIDNFRKLEKLTHPVKEKEQQIIKKHSGIDPQLIKKVGRAEAISQLKKIAGKK